MAEQFEQGNFPGENPGAQTNPPESQYGGTGQDSSYGQSQTGFQDAQGGGPAQDSSYDQSTATDKSFEAPQTGSGDGQQTSVGGDDAEFSEAPTELDQTPVSGGQTGVTDPTDVNTGVGPTGTDTVAPRDFSSYNAHQDEFGQTEPDNTPSSDTGYGADQSEDQPPHHTLHSANEPLPTPTDSSYAGDSGYGASTDNGTGTGAEETGPSPPAGDSTYGSDAGFPADSQQTNTGVPSNSTETQSYDQPQQTQSTGTDYQPTNTDSAGGYEQIGTGADSYQPTETPAPNGTNYDTPADTSPGATDTNEAPPKKEGFLSKLKDHLPGHHSKSSPDSATVDDTSAPPKKLGVISKIKDKLSPSSDNE